MSEWMETVDGRVIDVTYKDENYIRGREIIMTGSKLKYGAAVTVLSEEIKDDSGTEDDLAVIFKNMDAEVDYFFSRAEKMFAEERDFYGVRS